MNYKQILFADSKTSSDCFHFTPWQPTEIVIGVALCHIRAADGGQVKIWRGCRHNLVDALKTNIPSSWSEKRSRAARLGNSVKNRKTLCVRRRETLTQSERNMLKFSELSSDKLCRKEVFLLPTEHFLSLRPFRFIFERFSREESAADNVKKRWLSRF